MFFVDCLSVALFAERPVSVPALLINRRHSCLPTLPTIRFASLQPIGIGQRFLNCRWFITLSHHTCAAVCHISSCGHALLYVINYLVMRTIQNANLLAECYYVLSRVQNSTFFTNYRLSFQFKLRTIDSIKYFHGTPIFSLQLRLIPVRS